MSNYEKFIYAIHNKNMLNLTFDSKQKGVITRLCIPFDYGPSRRYSDGGDRYHFYDLNSPDGKHNLSIVPEQVLKIEVLDRKFEPVDYIHWKPNWFVKRDWGEYS